MLDYPKQQLLNETTSRRRAHGTGISLLYPFTMILQRVLRREDGVWCRRDTLGRLYPVNAYGARCSQPKIFKTETSESRRGQQRPEEISSHMWWNMMSKDERLKWWEEHLEVRPAGTSMPAIVCHPIGIS